MITLDNLVELNTLICEDNGQQCTIINRNNLLSALSVQQWYSNDALLAAALIRSITIAHGFQDGNKRTAAAIGMMVKDFECTEDVMIETILSIAKGELRNVDEIATMLYPISYEEVTDV